RRLQGLQPAVAGRRLRPGAVPTRRPGAVAGRGAQGPAQPRQSHRPRRPDEGGGGGSAGVPAVVIAARRVGRVGCPPTRGFAVNPEIKVLARSRRPYAGSILGFSYEDRHASSHPALGPPPPLRPRSTRLVGPMPLRTLRRAGSHGPPSPATLAA